MKFMTAGKSRVVIQHIAVGRNNMEVRFAGEQKLLAVQREALVIKGG